MIRDLLVKWGFPAGISLMSLVFQLTGLDLVLRYARKGIEAGEWWLYMTGNLVHLGWGHLILNVAGLMMVWWFFVRDLQLWEWLVVFVVSALFVTVGIYHFNPNIIWYVGLSGLLHGLFIAGGLRLLSTERNFALILTGAIVIKLAYEQVYGSLPGTSEMSGGPVVVDAHLYGAIGGAAAYLIITLVHFVGKMRHSSVTK